MPCPHRSGACYFPFRGSASSTAVKWHGFPGRARRVRVPRRSLGTRGQGPAPRGESNVIFSGTGISPGIQIEWPEACVADRLFHQWKLLRADGAATAGRRGRHRKLVQQCVLLASS